MSHYEMSNTLKTRGERRTDDLYASAIDIMTEPITAVDIANILMISKGSIFCVLNKLRDAKVVIREKVDGIFRYKRLVESITRKELLDILSINKFKPKEPVSTIGRIVTFSTKPMMDKLRALDKLNHSDKKPCKVYIAGRSLSNFDF